MKKLIYILPLLFFAKITLAQDKQQGTLQTIKVQGGGGGNGTVKSVSKTDGYGYSSTITNPTTTPNITGSVDTVVIPSKPFLANELAKKQDTAYHTNFYAESPLSVRDTIILEGADTVHGVVSSLDTLWTNNIIAPILRHVSTDVNSVNANNAAAPLTTPTYDGSGQGVHPDIYYNPLGWNGYKWWMAFEPYANSNSYLENPSILVSNDNTTWVVPPGLTNPLVPPLDTTGFHNHNNSDADIFQGGDGKLYVIYRTKTRLTPTDTLNIKVSVVSSSDGITWSSPTVIFNVDSIDANSKDFTSPSVIYENGKYYMWFINTWGIGDSDRLWVMQSDSVLTGWSTPQVCSLVRGRPASANNKYLWHLDVLKNEDEYDMLITTTYDNSGSLSELYFAKSIDKINWEMSDTAILKRGSGAWDNAAIYRSTSVLLNHGQDLGIYYSAVTVTGGLGVWHIGYTEAHLKSNTVVTKETLGLSNVDNTSDANKPVSTATQTALNLKADLIGSNIFQNNVVGTNNTMRISNNIGSAVLSLTGVGTSTNVLTSYLGSGATINFQNTSNTDGNFALFNAKNASGISYAGVAFKADKQGSTGVAAGSVHWFVRNSTQNYFEPGSFDSSGNLFLKYVNDVAGDFLTRNASTGLITRRTASETLSDIGAQSLITKGTATLVAGTVTISSTAVTATSKITVTVHTPGGTQGFISVPTRTTGTSFVINSTSATETSTVDWTIIN